MNQNKLLIWDLPLRLFHWSVALTFAALWLTAELGSEYMQYHIYCGYFMLALLCFRIVWGFVGTRYSKFKQFFPSVSRIRNYSRQLSSKPAEITAGHNPLGALMVFTLLILLTLQATSGLFISDDVFSSGPYYGSVGESWEKLFNIIHDLGATLLQICALLHIVAVLVYKFVKKQDLISPMIKGTKSSLEIKSSEGIQHSKLLLALLIALLSALFVYWLVVINAPVLEDYYYY